MFHSFVTSAVGSGWLQSVGFHLWDNFLIYPATNDQLTCVGYRTYV